MSNCNELTAEISAPKTITEDSENQATSVGHSHKIEKATQNTAGIVKVVDHTESTDPLEALSANQGRELAKRLSLLAQSNGSREINQRLESALSYLATRYTAAYATYQAAKDNLCKHPENSLIYVVNDPTKESNGLWTVVGGSLVKAPWDALSSALTSEPFEVLQSIFQGDAGEQIEYEGKTYDTLATLTQTLAEGRNYIQNVLIDLAQSNNFTASYLLTASGKFQEEINDLTGAPYRVKAEGYALNARVMLDNGDIVRSTVAGNRVDPNVSMAGWVNVNAASQIIDASGVMQQEINDLTGAPYRVKVGGYRIGERVVLENGQIVQNTIAGNTVNPNVDMTGWVGDTAASFVVDFSGKTQQKVNDAVLYSVSSVAELRLTAPIKKGQKVYLESYILDNGLGGGEFIATQKTGLADNNGTIFASPDPLLFWVRADQRYPCPEWWGATGKDNGVDATVAVRAAVDYGRINKKVVTCDNHYILSDEIYAGTFEGITSTNRGTFHINADVTPFRFAGIAGNKWFERVSFRYKVAATNIKPTILFDFQFLVLGMKLRDLEFWGDTGKTWVGVGIKGKNNYGFSGGFEFSNIRSHNMHADLHFIGGATFWANAGRISNNMCYYNNYGILIDEGCNVNNLLIQNYQGQENVQYTICANGRLGKSIIDLSYNWDTNRPAIFLSEFCGGVTIRGTYLHDIVDLGYKTLIDVKNIDVLTDTAIAATLITMEGEYTEASLDNVLKITKTGNVQVSEGTHSEFTTGNNRTGYTVYTTPATAEPVTQAGQLKMFNPATQITGLATRLAGYSQFTAVRFQANFEILTTTLDDDAFIFGVGHAASNNIPSTLWVGITVRSGRLKVISKTGASTETVIADLGAVTKRRIDFQMIIKARDGSNKQPIHVNGKMVGYYEVNPSFNKSPFVSIKSVSNPTGIHVISLGVRNVVSAGHSAVTVS